MTDRKRCSLEKKPESENHLEAILSYNLEQYKNSDFLLALIKSFIPQMQHVEDTFLDLQLKRFITTAFGYTLDRIGTIVGELRNFKSDDEYRTAILIKSLINNGGGTPEDIISAIRILYVPKKIIYSEVFPANFSLFIQSGDIELSNIRQLVSSIKPAGVGQFIITASGSDNLFIFSESTSELVDFLVQLPPEQNLDVNEASGVSNLLVEADTVSSPTENFGFGEFIFTSQTVEGGGTLSEIINNG